MQEDYLNKNLSTKIFSMKERFSMKDFFNKFYQILSFLLIWSHLLNIGVWYLLLFAIFSLIFQFLWVMIPENFANSYSDWIILLVRMT